MTAVSLVLPREAVWLHWERKIEFPSSQPPTPFQRLASVGSSDMVRPPSHSVWAPRPEVTSHDSVGSQSWLQSPCSPLCEEAEILCWWLVGRKARIVALGRDCPLNFHFLCQVKIVGVGRWSSFGKRKKKKDSQAKFNHWKERMLLPVPASSEFWKGDLCCKKQLLEVISGEHPPFFCLTNHPFCAVWVQWRVTWNLQESYFKPSFFVPNVLEAKTWQGRSSSFTLLPLGWPSWFTTFSYARVPEALSLFIIIIAVVYSIPLEEKIRLPNMTFSAKTTRFLGRKSWKQIPLNNHCK